MQDPHLITARRYLSLGNALHYYKVQGEVNGVYGARLR